MDRLSNPHTVYVDSKEIEHASKTGSTTYDKFKTNIGSGISHSQHPYTNRRVLTAQNVITPPMTQETITPLITKGLAGVPGEL
jgi:hypothetical protein